MRRHAPLLEKKAAPASRGARTPERAAPSRVSAPPRAAGAPSASGGVGDVQRMQRLAGNQAVLQLLNARRAGPPAASAAVQALPVQRMNSGSEEQTAPRREGHKDVAAARKRIRQAFRLNDEDYSFVQDEKGEYRGGAGNCHGYSLAGDPDEYLDFDLDDYGGQPITVFTKGGEVAHSAQGHDDECVHKVYIEGGWGPLIRASARATDGGYDGQFKLPDELEQFHDWMRSRREQEEVEEQQRTVINTFGYYLDYDPDGLVARVPEERRTEYLDLASEEPSNEVIQRVLAAMKQITGKDFSTSTAFMDEYDGFWDR